MRGGHLIVWPHHNFTKIRPALFYADYVDRVPVFFILVKIQLRVLSRPALPELFTYIWFFVRQASVLLPLIL